MKPQPGPALFVTPTAPGQAIVLSVWSPAAELIGRSADVGMTAAITKAALTDNPSVTVSGDDGRCVLVTADAGVMSLADHGTDGWPSSLSRALMRLTSQPARCHNNIPPLLKEITHDHQR
jgi:hypothetical protein